MPDLASLNYAALNARVSKAELAAFRTAHEVIGYDEKTGFDEQKAPVTTGKVNTGLWERRFRLSAFAEANGLTYAFRSNPARWPGQLATSCTLYDVLEGSTESGQRFMACAQEAIRRGNVGTRGVEDKTFAVVAVEVGATAPTVYLEHNWVRHPDAPNLLSGNYRLRDDLYTADDNGAGFSAARALFTNEVLEPVVNRTRGYDLFLAGGWLYLLKEFDSGAIQKKHADPDILRERFELAAVVGPALLASAEAQAKGRPGTTADS